MRDIARHERELVEHVVGGIRLRAPRLQQRRWDPAPQRLLRAAEIEDVQVAGEVRARALVAQDLVQRKTPQHVTRDALVNPALREFLALGRARRIERRVLARERSTQVEARQAVGDLPTQRRRQAQVEQLVVDELAHERGGHLPPARREHAFLDARSDFLRELARQLCLVDQRRHDTHLAPGLRAILGLHLDALLARAGAIVHRQRLSRARAAVAIEDVGLGDIGPPELDQRLLDQVLNLLDAGHGCARRRLRAVASLECERDHTRDLAGKARIHLPDGLEGLGDGCIDLARVEGHLPTVALAHACRHPTHPPGGAARGSASIRRGTGPRP